MTDPHADRKVLNLYSRARLDDRAINELLGLAKGIAADGVVNQKEAEFFAKVAGGKYRGKRQSRHSDIVQADKRNAGGQQS